VLIEFDLSKNQSTTGVKPGNKIDTSSAVKNYFEKPAIIKGREMPTTVDDAKIYFKRVFGPRIEEMKMQSDAVEISDIESEKQAVAMAGQVKKIVKALDKQRKEIIADPDQFVRGVNSFVKSFRDMLSPIEQQLRAKIDNYKWQKELERRKKEKKARAEAEKLKKQMEAEAKKKGVDDMPAPQIVIPVEKPETVVRTEEGTAAHLRTVWKMTEVTDFSKVPDKYKQLNKREVNNAIRAGVREIPGLIIEKKPETVIRTN